MRIRLERYSYRFAEQVLNSKLAVKQEVESILEHPSIEISKLSRPYFNEVLDALFVGQGWERQPRIFEQAEDPAMRLDFLKDRVGVEVGFSHHSFLRIDLLKFQVASYSGLNRIDVGVYIAATVRFQKMCLSEHGHKWEGSNSFEKIHRYLPYFKSAIQVPIYVLGIDI
jgi:hypothetical protein